MSRWQQILAKAKNLERITEEEAAHVWREAPLAALMEAAHAVRLERADPRVVTFVIDRNINYTNICNVYCSFCAFYRTPKDQDTYVLSKEQVLAKIEELVELKGTQVLLQGGLNPDLPIEYMEDLFRAIAERFPQVDIHSLTATEIEFWAKKHNTTYEAILKRLKAAGMKSLPGGGMEILVDSVRKRVSPLKTSAEEYINVHRECHKLGMTTTATMMYGMGETVEDRVEHLRKVRALQDEADRAGRRGFTAFIPWSYQTDGESTALRAPPPKELGIEMPKKEHWGATANDYLRVIAVSRLYLDNFANIQSGWVTEGSRIAQIALHGGANDWGGILMEENVISAAGTAFTMSPKDACGYIRDAGFIPAQRDTYYTVKRVFDKGDPEERVSRKLTLAVSQKSLLSETGRTS
ncbi:MAG TPA: cyclic dehypoxanthinyl futalosine synthase [Candidatus Thermoplasmatota archaeon]|nr:cyclic dehypoxanthinyl futalosine synthase [Candidatus Thermoplasmatota archaeon]